MKFIYLIKSNINGDDLYKIGITQNINKRLKQLRTANPDLTLLDSFETKHGNKIESTLHNLYKNKRIDGEWFLLEELDVISFDEICSNIERGLDSLKDDNNPFY